MSKVGIRILIIFLVLFYFCVPAKKTSVKEIELLTKATFDENLLSKEVYLKLKS